MIYLDSTAKSLTVSLDGAVATSQCVVTSYYYDILQQSTAPVTRGAVKVATTNGASSVTMVAAPLRPQVIRNIHTIMVNNRDTATRIVTITLTDGVTNPVQVKQTLNSGYSLVYETNNGWQVLGTTSPPFTDALNILYNNTDPSKLARFDLGSITTGQTRVYTLPDANGTLLLASGGGLTASRLVYTTTPSGDLTTDANATYDGTNMVLQPSGTITIKPTTLGNLDNVRLGFTTRAAIQATTGDFSGNLSVIKGGQILGLLDSRTGGNVGSAIQLLGWNTVNKNWQVDVGYGSAGLIFTPSTVAGGATFTTSVATLSEAGALTLSAGLTATTGNFSGVVTHSSTSTLSGALTYGGVTLSNAVTGTGNMVLSASPTLTGTLTAATSSFSGHMTIEGVASTGATGTGKFVFDNAPTFSALTSISASGATEFDALRIINTNNDSGTATSVAMRFRITNSVRQFTAVKLTAVENANDTHTAYLSVLINSAAADDSPTEQVRFLATASANRYLTLTGSNGGNPTIDVSAGSLQLNNAIATTQSTGDNSTKIATTAYVDGNGFVKILTNDNSQHASTNTTGEETLYTYSLAGNLMGSNGGVRVKFAATNFSGVGNKTIKVKYGGTTMSNITLVGNNMSACETFFGNQAATNSQRGYGVIIGASVAGDGTSGGNTGAIDSTTAQNITITSTKNTGTDGLTFENVTVELLKA